MDFTLSKEHEMARTLFREFAEKEVKPLDVDEPRIPIFFSFVPNENPGVPFSTMNAEISFVILFMGIPIPKEYGGQGCDVLTYAMCVEELAKVCGTTAVIVSAHTSLCIFEPLRTHSSPSSTAFVCCPCASVPAPGSVRPKAPIFLPLARSGGCVCDLCDHRHDREARKDDERDLGVHPLLHIRNRSLKSTLAETERLRGDTDTSAVKCVHGDAEALALLS